jgi:hypothetical protein
MNTTRKQRGPMSEEAKASMAEKRRATIARNKSLRAEPKDHQQQQQEQSQDRQSSPTYPESESERSKVFKYLYDLHLKTEANPWDLIPALTVNMNKTKGIAEQYIIEYQTQQEKVLDAYIPVDDQVYGPTHYKTLSAMLARYYAVCPYNP